MTVTALVPRQEIQLPRELITLALSHLSVRQLEVARQVCQEWYEVANTLILERLYDAPIARSISDKASFFMGRKGDYICKMGDVKAKGLFKFGKKSTYSLQKTVNPLILSLTLQNAPIKGGELIDFAKAHPNLMVLSLQDCKEIRFTHLLVALSYFNNLRSVSLDGEGLFDPDLLDKLSAKSPDLQKLKIRDFSGPSIKDKRASLIQKGLQRKLSVLELNLPQKAIM